MTRLWACLVLASMLVLVACGGGGAKLSAEAQQGKEYYAKYACASCHGDRGEGGIGPALKGIYGKEVKLADGSTVTADEAYLRESILDPDAKIVAGYSAGTMAATMQVYKAELEKPEVLTALIAYLKELQEKTTLPPLYKPPRVTSFVWSLFLSCKTTTWSPELNADPIATA